MQTRKSIEFDVIIRGDISYAVLGQQEGIVKVRKVQSQAL
jgi:hypothetical protein